MAKHFSFEGYRFGANCHLTRSHMEHLTSCFQSGILPSPGRLGGRGSVSRIHLHAIGDVIVKHFRRGGWMTLLAESSYFGVRKRRAQLEFEQMNRVRELGVNTPDPLAYAARGRLIYQNWLITREIPSVQTMAELSRRAPERAAAALPSIGRQAAILIDHGILHADFHPGNVLVDRQNRVYLIDFDKTATFKGNKDVLTSKYRQRWLRAVRKHALPRMLGEDINTWLG